MTRNRALCLPIWLAYLLGSSACGDDSMIILQVHSDLEIPAEADALQVVIVSPDSIEELSARVLTLKSKHKFPVEVSYRPSDSTPTTLELHITVLSGATAQEEINVMCEWERHKINYVPLYPNDNSD